MSELPYWEGARVSECVSEYIRPDKTVTRPWEGVRVWGGRSALAGARLPRLQHRAARPTYQMSIRWQSGSHQVVIRWQSGGHQVVIRWQAGGHQVSIRRTRRPCRRREGTRGQSRHSHSQRPTARQRLSPLVWYASVHSTSAFRYTTDLPVAIARAAAAVTKHAIESLVRVSRSRSPAESSAT